MTIEPDQQDGVPAKRHALSFITPRASKRAARARSESATRFVGRMRLALPIAGLLALFVLVLWPMIDPRKIKTAVIKNIPDLVIENLHFNGLDSKNEPYSMTALRAKRPGGLQSIYDLDHPQGEITLGSGVWIAGKALYGRYDQSTRRLWLGGDVQIFHDKGYQFTTDEAQVDINENDAWGEKPVLIQGDFGEIRGQGFRVLDSGKTVIVKGPATAHLSLHTGLPSDKPTETPEH